ncbi:unnamed protein product, partial [Owenia fusiformis]
MWDSSYLRAILRTAMETAREEYEVFIGTQSDEVTMMFSEANEVLRRLEEKHSNYSTGLAIKHQSICVAQTIADELKHLHHAIVKTIKKPWGKTSGRPYTITIRRDKPRDIFYILKDI